MKETSQEPSSNVAEFRSVGSVGSGLSSVAQPSPHLMRTSLSPRDAQLLWLWNVSPNPDRWVPGPSGDTGNWTGATSEPEEPSLPDTLSLLHYCGSRGMKAVQ